MFTVNENASLPFLITNVLPKPVKLIYVSASQCKGCALAGCIPKLRVPIISEKSETRDSSFFINGIVSFRAKRGIPPLLNKYLYPKEINIFLQIPMFIHYLNPKLLNIVLKYRLFILPYPSFDACAER